MKAIPIPKLKKQLTTLFNTYIRQRDNGLPCISCGKDKVLQAGHYVPQKQSSYLRFNEWNVNGECGGCNAFDDFHLIPYRKNLIEKIGLSKVKWLEDNRKIVKLWIRQELTGLITEYKSKINS